MNKLNHLAIIVDGNGRWAKSIGKIRSYGHLKGYENLKKIINYVNDNLDIKYISLFVFSTENFKRSKDEVDYLMNLFLKGFKSSIKEFNKNNIKVVFSGRKEPLSDKVYKSMKSLEKETLNNTGGILNICLNYGGQTEIVDTTKKLINDVLDGKLKTEDITPEIFMKNLYNDLPPIYFLIRTSGEIRVSNFMLFSLAYAEMYFPLTYFPDFKEDEFDKALEEYTKRDRRFGKNK